MADQIPQMGSIDSDDSDDQSTTKKRKHGHHAGNYKRGGAIERTTHDRRTL